MPRTWPAEFTRAPRTPRILDVLVAPVRGALRGTLLWMKKTSLYLDEPDIDRLRRLAELEGRSQAAVVRAAIAAYEASRTVRRDFALADAWEGDGSSVADVPEDELLRGFGA